MELIGNKSLLFFHPVVKWTAWRGDIFLEMPIPCAFLDIVISIL